MNNSFKENYHWVTLISIVLIYGYYFVKVLPPSGPDITAENVTLFAGLLVLLVVLHIVGAIVLERQHPFYCREIGKDLACTKHNEVCLWVCVGEKMLCFGVIYMLCLLTKLPMREKFR